MQEIEKEIYRSIISIKAMGFECVSRDLAPELSSSLSRLADERDYAVSKISRYHHDMVNISKYLIPKRTHHMNVLVDALMALYGLTYTHAPDYSLIENIRDFDSHEICQCGKSDDRKYEFEKAREVFHFHEEEHWSRLKSLEYAVDVVGKRVVSRFALYLEHSRKKCVDYHAIASIRFGSLNEPQEGSNPHTERISVRNFLAK